MDAISVVFINYNKKRALDKSLKNTMGQLNFEEGDEVIVADGGSTDGVEKMLEKKYMPPVKFVKVEKRTEFNLNSVRNLGVRNAKNEKIAIFDADVIPQPGCIDVLRSFARKGFFASGLVIYEQSMKEQERMAKKHKGLAMPQFALGVAPIVHILNGLESDQKKVRGTIGSCICFHKQDAYDVGIFDEDYNGCWGYDETDFILKLHFNGVKVLTPQNTKPLGMAISYHQRHKSNDKWKEKCLERNIVILRSKLPDYKRGIFPNV